MIQNLEIRWPGTGPVSVADQRRLRLYGKSGMDALDYFGKRKPIPTEVRYAFLTTPFVKPVAFTNSRELALCVLRRTKGKPFELRFRRLPVRSALCDGPQSIRVAEVVTLHEGLAHEQVGFAYLNGSPETCRWLRAELLAVRPDLGGGQ